MIRAIVVTAAFLVAMTLPAAAQRCSSPGDAFFGNCQVSTVASTHKKIHHKAHKKSKKNSTQMVAGPSLVVHTDPEPGEESRPVATPGYYDSVSVVINQCISDWEKRQAAARKK